jgi:hypothetical protein
MRSRTDNVVLERVAAHRIRPISIEESTDVKSTEPKQKIGGKAATRASVENERSADTEDQQGHIATAAYYRAEARGFIPGLEMDDWLEAEADLNNSAG